MCVWDGFKNLWESQKSLEIAPFIVWISSRVEILSTWQFKCSETHATLHEANPGPYFLTCDGQMLYKRTLKPASSWPMICLNIRPATGPLSIWPQSPSILHLLAEAVWRSTVVPDWFWTNFTNKCHFGCFFYLVIAYLVYFVFNCFVINNFFEFGGFTMHKRLVDTTCYGLL